MAPVNTEYYDLLGVPPEASVADIRKAYKQQALRLHPDRGGDEAQFKRMKAAYDVLVDPTRRTMYDQYGPDAVRLMDGNDYSPEVVLHLLGQVTEKLRPVALVLVAVVAGFFLYPAIMITLRWDQKAQFNWGLAFVPLWLAEAASAVVMSCCCLFPPVPDRDGEDEEQRAERVEILWKVRRGLMVGLIGVLLLAWLQVFVALKLQGNFNHNWFVALSPLMLFILLNVLRKATVVQSEYDEVLKGAEQARQQGGNPRPLPSFTTFLLDHFRWSALWFLTTLLVAARAELYFTASWFWCLVPFLAGFTWSIVEVLWRPGRAGRRQATPGSPLSPSDMEAGSPPDEDDEPSKGGEVCSICCTLGILLFMLALAAGKADGGTYSAAFVFLPLFTIVCCATCICCRAVVAFDPQEIIEADRTEEDRGNRPPGGSTYGATGDGAPADAGPKAPLIATAAPPGSPPPDTTIGSTSTPPPVATS